jgi:hypothetical protein
LVGKCARQRFTCLGLGIEAVPGCCEDFAVVVGEGIGHCCWLFWLEWEVLVRDLVVWVVVVLRFTVGWKWRL